MAKTNSLRLPVPHSHALRDLAVVAFLVVILGAFVVQIASGPSGGGREPVAIHGLAATALA